MHPCRQFPGHFVVRMPLCLHLLFCVVRPLFRNPGGGGAREPSLGVRSLGGARGRTRSCLLDKGGGGYVYRYSPSWSTAFVS